MAVAAGDGAGDEHRVERRFLGRLDGRGEQVVEPTNRSRAATSRSGGTPGSRGWRAVVLNARKISPLPWCPTEPVAGEAEAGAARERACTCPRRAARRWRRRRCTNRPVPRRPRPVANPAAASRRPTGSPATTSCSIEPKLASTSTPTVASSSSSRRDALPMPPLHPNAIMPAPAPTAPSAGADAGRRERGVDRQRARPRRARARARASSSHESSHSPTTGIATSSMPISGQRGEQRVVHRVVGAPDRHRAGEQDRYLEQAPLRHGDRAGQLARAVQHRAPGRHRVAEEVVERAGDDRGDARCARDRRFVVPAGRVPDAHAGHVDDACSSGRAAARPISTPHARARGRGDGGTPAPPQRTAPLRPAVARVACAAVLRDAGRVVGTPPRSCDRRRVLARRAPARRRGAGAGRRAAGRARSAPAQHVHRAGRARRRAGARGPRRASSSTSSPPRTTGGSPAGTRPTPGSRCVVPYVFASAQLTNGRPVPPAAVGTRRSGPLRDRHDDADRAGHLRRGAGRGRCRVQRGRPRARRRARRVRGRAAAGPPRRARLLRRVVLPQQRGGRRAVPARPRRRRASRSSTSTRTTATARRRSSTTATTCSTGRCTSTRRHGWFPHFVGLA